MFVSVSLSVKFLVHMKFCSLFLIGLYLYIWSSTYKINLLRICSIWFFRIIGMLKSPVLLLLLRWGIFALCVFMLILLEAL